MRSFLYAAACIALSSVPALAETFLDNATEPLSRYWTRPQSLAPALNVTINKPGQAPGLIFMGPYGNGYTGAGPRIYDKQGNLVWDGYGVLPGNAHNVHVCTYQGSPHLCMVLGSDQVGFAAGMGIIVDSNYRIVQTVQTGRGAMPVDEHEFHLVDNGTHALVTFYQTVPFDLSPINITSGMGFLMQGGFQEIDVESGDVLFEWYSVNHVDLLDSVIQPNTSDVSGTGTTGTSGFDYFHINSVDKSLTTGNYLVSSRHTGTLYCVNASDQNVLWRLSFVGHSDYTLQGFNFSFQHDARWVSDNDDVSVISLFDNAFNGFGDPATGASAPTSSGQVISLNHTDKTATLLSITYPPYNTTSLSQGNTQLLSNGNVFHGWGDVPEISEHSSNGSVILAASFANKQGSIMNYRAFTFDNWNSTPANTVPAVYSYAVNSSAPTSIYTSWNGATDVSMWRYYGAQNVGENFTSIGNTAKNGFETLWTAPEFYAWVMVEAVSGYGISLRNSSFQPTFTPSEQLLASCTETGCDALPTEGFINAGISAFQGTS
ncbi:hypothetical protein PRZ48_002979 [Zasmidium cellare]|uniref:ASST-domain-containing protein n=1 Tax=Zasmidium cellare TaxID=395010 RepID=A0ABR0EV02_ZASCE|nr:hypothetical protein PRZ48_002979 [Zasmidium cellare]